MTVSRRGFIKSTAVAVAAAGVALEFGVLARANSLGADGKLLPFGSTGRSPLNFSRSTFSPHLNSTFRVHLNDVTVIDLKLVEVGPESLSPESGLSKNAPQRSTAFSLEFTGSGRQTFDSGNYLFEHAELGKFLLLISPISMPGRTARYEAVFNHL